MYPDARQALSHETPDAVYFFSHAFDPLNNWSAHQVEIWGKRFATVEHGFHFRKFADAEPEVAAQILAAPSPFAALQLAKTHKAKRRADWDAVKVGLMAELVRAKAAQHQDVRETLLATGTKAIVENSPWDDFWGCGKDGLGANHMGHILMDVRGQLPRIAKTQG
ncbi:MAG TPA: NADAR family protein [Candidatus Saccharimonadales bacterium]|nr:NADAR family protein [Candidatus Saccharimonadales bacterium]